MSRLQDMAREVASRLAEAGRFTAATARAHMAPRLLRARRLARRAGAARAVTASAAAMVVLAAGVAASSRPGPVVVGGPAHIAAITGADLSNAALLRLTSTMSPSAAALAARHDPALPPPLWGRPAGWAGLDLSSPPDLGLGAGLDTTARQLNAAIPAATADLRPARPFVLSGAPADRKRALRCLTQAIYYEAAREGVAGQEAVAQVVLNRVRDPNFPNTVCGVVFQGAERSTGCQFSFTCDGSMAYAPEPGYWARAQAVAERALNGYVATAVGTSTHYHADYVMPWWSPTVTKVNQLGTHIFYRWSGLAGETRSLNQRYAGREPVINEARFSRPRPKPQDDKLSPQQVAAAAAQAGFGPVRAVPGGRVASVVSLGGRRQPSAEDIAKINDSLKRYEASLAAPAPAPSEEQHPPDAEAAAGEAAAG